jgi:hypothetical protein
MVLLPKFPVNLCSLKRAVAGDDHKQKKNEKGNDVLSVGQFLPVSEVELAAALYGGNKYHHEEREDQIKHSRSNCVQNFLHQCVPVMT